MMDSASFRSFDFIPALSISSISSEIANIGYNFISAKYFSNFLVTGMFL